MRPAGITAFSLRGTRTAYRYQAGGLDGKSGFTSSQRCSRAFTYRLATTGFIDYSGSCTAYLGNRGIFLQVSSNLECDAVVGVIRYETLQARYGDTRRTVIRLQDGNFVAVIYSHSIMYAGVRWWISGSRRKHCASVRGS